MGRAVGGSITLGPVRSGQSPCLGTPRGQSTGVGLPVKPINWGGSRGQSTWRQVSEAAPGVARAL
eukprot:6829673-Karenia_brevis.AAC.1